MWKKSNGQPEDWIITLLSVAVVVAVIAVLLRAVLT